MRLKHVVKYLLIAPIGSVIVHTLFEAFLRRSPLRSPADLIVFAGIWASSLFAAMLFVLPLLVAIPGLRRPPFWLAAGWGAAAATAFHALFIRVSISGAAWWGLAPAGASSGLIYAALVRSGTTVRILRRHLPTQVVGRR